MTCKVEVAIFSSFGFQKSSVIVTCEKLNGSSLVIPDCAKAEKEVAANKQESADLIIMGLSDLLENERAAKNKSKRSCLDLSDLQTL
jgi:hypothetical protein